MKNNLPIDNPPKTREQAALQQPAQPIHAGKSGFHAAVADAHSHHSLLDAADDAQFHHLQLFTFDRGFSRLMKRSLVLPAK